MCVRVSTYTYVCVQLSIYTCVYKSQMYVRLSLYIYTYIYIYILVKRSECNDLIAAPWAKC